MPGSWELVWRGGVIAAGFARRLRGIWVGAIAIGVFLLCLAYPLVMLALFFFGVVEP